MRGNYNSRILVLFSELMFWIFANITAHVIHKNPIKILGEAGSCNINTPSMIALSGLNPTVTVMPVGVAIFIDIINNKTIIAAPGIANINNNIQPVRSNDNEPVRGFPNINANMNIKDDPMSIGHAVNVNPPYFFMYFPADNTYRELQKAAKNINKSPFHALGAI